MFGIEGRKRLHRLGRNARQGSAPARMGRHEGAGRRDDDNGRAVGEAQQGRHIRHRHGRAVGPLLSGFNNIGPRFAGRIGQGEHHVAVHLIEHQQLSSRKPRRVKQAQAIVAHGSQIVAHVASKVKRIVGRRAHAARTPREAHAHASRAKERLVS